MENLDIYNKLRNVPESAKKQIQAGRLRGKTDINPMWRLKTLTEVFGPCGIGWKYEITEKWTEKGAAGEIACFVIINLFIKYEGNWSEAIPGVGGSSFVANESKGLYTSDECYKMALTDAISVSCKALGVGADVYWDKDNTKYTKPEQVPAKTPQSPQKKSLPRDKFDEITLMAWIYKKELEAKDKGVRFSSYGLLESSYALTKEEINVITANYQEYKTNNNL